MKEFEDFNLIHNNAYKLNATCKKAYFPDKNSDLLKIFSRDRGKRKIVLGNGNNIILQKERYDEDFIILNNCFNKINFEGTEVSAEAGATLLDLSLQAYKNSLSGLEMFYDIPSSVGGAVVMNAGSSGEEIKDLITKVRYLDLIDLTIKELTVLEMDFDYRSSFFQKNPDTLILKCWFRLSPGRPEDVIQKMNEIKAKRWIKQPREYPNCGSVFKRPSGKFVGPMLDELGLKGFQIGGAQISHKHSGFIINRGNATGQDILNLISHVQRKVKNEYKVELEVEQRII